MSSSTPLKPKRFLRVSRYAMIDLKSFYELMPSRWRVTAYLPEDMQKAIEEWAAEENRSVSNLAATVLINAIKEHQRQKQAITIDLNKEDESK